MKNRTEELINIVNNICIILIAASAFLWLCGWIFGLQGKF
jgi:hypothetical protein